MRCALLFLILGLAACDTPHPDFAGAAVARVTVEGSRFDVRIMGRRAEAIRLNAQYAPRLGLVGPRAILAIEKVSACKVARVRGDAAVLFADLDCGSGAPAAPRARLVEYQCDVIDDYISPATGEWVASLDCDRI